MSEMPDGWRQAKLASFLGHDGLFSDGDWVERKDQDPSGSIRLLQLADIGDGRFLDRSRRFVNEAKFKELRCTELWERDVLVARMPDPLGRACLMPRLPQRCITVVDVAVIRPGPNAVTPQWLMYFLNSPEIRQTIELLSSGTTRKRISRNNLGQIEIPVPPLNEQQRIADKLDALLARVDACRERLDRVPLILKRFRQAILDAATSGRLTEDWRATQGEPFLSRSVTLREIATSFNYGTPAKSQRSGQVPVLRMGNIQDGKLDWTNLVFTSNGDEIQKYRLHPGDVLFNRTNSPELVGKTAVFKGESPAIFAGYLIRVQCSEAILPDYLSYCLNSPAGRKWSWQVKSDGVSQSNINAQKLAEFKIELPPLTEQHEIIRRVEAIFAYADRLGLRYRAACAQVERLTPSLLAKAFRGELVPQDPDDEPAEVLLERIRAERANAVTPIKPPRRRRVMEQNEPEMKFLIGTAGIVHALQEVGKELSGKDLLAAAGYPPDADSESIETFFVAVRDALKQELITRERRNNTDWFSLALR